MNQRKILHICPLDKFIPPFIELIRNNFSFERHFFLTFGDKGRFPYESKSDSKHLPITGFLRFETIKAMYVAEKIILHGLFYPKLILCLALQPWLLKKCYWVVWGGDLYLKSPKSASWKYRLFLFIRQRVIKKMGYFVTGNLGDYKLIQSRYGATGEMIDCVCYLSNVFYPHTIIEEKKQSTVILVGNSADPTNNHIEILNTLDRHKNKITEIICPLSYGDSEYAKNISEVGISMFGDKFVALTSFIPYRDYLSLLKRIDIAVYAHNRQQAFGNKVQLLGMGKKVYLKRESSLWEYFETNNLKVFDFKEFNLDKMLESDVLKNQQLITSKFSEENLLKNLERLFNFSND